MSDRLSGPLQNVSRESCGRRFAIHACDRDDRNAAVVPFGKQRADDRLAHGTRLTGARCDVHSQSRSGVHFDNRAGPFFARLSNVDRDDVNPCDIQADHSSGLNRASSPFGMHFVGDVHRSAAGAEIRVAANQHSLTGRRN